VFSCGWDITMLTWALADRLRGKPVTANALNPGYVLTDLTSEYKAAPTGSTTLMVRQQSSAGAAGAAPTALLRPYSQG
jgi:NAD(P)-dependent dehydrogenase (short-subunit alcohol dehydrogenase family)